VLASHQKFASNSSFLYSLSDSDKKLENFCVPTECSVYCREELPMSLIKNGVVQMIFDSMLATKHIPKALEAIKN
jgi:peroxiredoxin Q/BCP